MWAILKQFWHRLGSPKWFYRMSSPWMLPLLILALVMLMVGFVWGLAYAPMDYKQGNSYRIIFIHVPTSFLALAGYYVMATAAIVGIVWKMKMAFSRPGKVMEF